MPRKHYFFSIIVMIFLLAAAITGTVQSASNFMQNEIAEITVDDILASGLELPVGIVNAGDGTGRLFILEKYGRIKVIRDGILLAQPFLDIGDKVNTEAERGLLGLAFHPNYVGNGFLYILYTRASDGAIILARYHVSTNPDIVDPDSEAILLTVDHPLPIHNAGQLVFGPDGKLYIAMGDGDEQGDPNNHAQDLTKLYGKILRIDVDSAFPYAIPADNPFVGKPGAKGEIWLLGLRNPWRFSFDRVTSDLWIGDVGFNSWEEINHLAAGSSPGVNFGWRCKEGTHVIFTDTPPCNDPGEVARMVDPVVEYPHSEGASVTGGYVYRGTLSPSLAGRYLFGDYVSGKIWSLGPKQGNTWPAPELLLQTGLYISSFGEDEQGELYLADYFGGTIRWIHQVDAMIPDLGQSTIQSSTQYADPGDLVDYTVMIQNSGGANSNTLDAFVSLPAQLAYQVGTLSASSGQVDDSNPTLLRWQGVLGMNEAVSLTYQVRVWDQAVGTQVSQVDFSGTGYVPYQIQHALQLPRPKLVTTINDFFLPGTQPGGLQEELTPPASCDVCHTEPIYNTWRGSLMSQAGHDPLFWSALEVANHDAPGSGEFCLRCHAPKGWYEGRSQPADGSSLTPIDLDGGLICSVCHRALEPAMDGSDEASDRDRVLRSDVSPPVPFDHVGSAMLILDPLDFRRGPFSLGINFSYHPNQTYGTLFLGWQQNDFVARSRLCGSCHNVENPVLSWNAEQGQFLPNSEDAPAPVFGQGQLFPVETTYDEWLYSEYAQSGVFAPQFAGEKQDGIVGACADCHMSRSTGYAAELSFSPVLRDCSGQHGCLPLHDFVGGNSWVPVLLQDKRWRLNSANYASHLNETMFSSRFMLSKAASLEAQIEGSGIGQVARVRVVNQTGHKLPTGYAEGRRMWINLKAFDASHNLIYESGAYNFTTGELTLDADAKVYEVKQGITPQLAATLGLTEGESFHFVLNNMVVKDNRIPPRGFTQAAYDRPGLQPVGAVYADGQFWDETVYPLPAQTAYLIVTLYYQTSSKEYIQFLKLNGGLDSQKLAEMWQDSPSPPEVMATLLIPGTKIWLPSVSQE
jgi:uncharacterized repeat protein (TIGR01451 family)